MYNMNCALNEALNMYLSGSITLIEYHNQMVILTEF